ncbi:MAG TPA: hypothetical protein VJ103_01625 [Candidatus Paceibacterota bacterium]|nr:hypothetical protein [Candidatus Paceibacterota bacterium]
MIDWKKYLIVFIITAFIFGLAFYLSNRLSTRKIGELETLQTDISIDILSSEIEFDLLAEKSCDSLGKSVLTEKLGELGQKVEYSEANIGLTPNVLRLKKQYTLLEIKDYLLMKQVLRRCNLPAHFILYFYSNKNCFDCNKQGYVLTSLRETYPELRVYSFDFDLDLSAASALKETFGVKEPLPVLVINEKAVSGFQDEETLEKLLGFKKK